jgi:hypothetical protein
LQTRRSSKGAICPQMAAERHVVRRAGFRGCRMQHRMMCADCYEVDVPDTALEGSDLLELLGWCCLGIPGLLYCWWRHLNRSKICPFCRGAALVREARASAERRGPAEPLSFVPRIIALSGARRIEWPRALRAPRARLRSGSAGVLLLSTPLIVWALVSMGRAAPATVTVVISLLTLLIVPWLLQQLAALRPTRSDCLAWSESGRSLRIERI